ncbi:hypothetical protein A6A06_28150 [Streptomyces sp. CB02923]|uniref:hypothetical protein n=1 Tax=Streptomyces sp. CB02923 TaxID=1718985 RepID=UPI00093ECA95|nr:hypothetical protein [Streptomyces sp. CB02923]OKH98099.1 hypothetical protein A6A06_28150 [Streptomyces sp. CB02923]
MAKVICIPLTRRVFLVPHAHGALIESAILLMSTAWLVNMYGAAAVFADIGEVVSFFPIRQIHDTGDGVIDLVPAWVAPTVTVLLALSGGCLIAGAGAFVRHMTASRRKARKARKARSGSC